MFTLKSLNSVGVLCMLMLIPLLMEAQQTITGNFPNLANQQLLLLGFNGFDTYTIDSVKFSEKGIFHLNFGTKDCGMAYLTAEDNKVFTVILAADENLKLEGKTLASPETKPAFCAICHRASPKRASLKCMGLPCKNL
jgi:hypothetical protein